MAKTTIHICVDKEVRKFLEEDYKKTLMKKIKNNSFNYSFSTHVNNLLKEIIKLKKEGIF